MGKIKNPAQFDNEIQAAWCDNNKFDRSLEILDSLSALNAISTPAGLKQKLLEIPEQSNWRLFSWLPIRATSLVLAPALALIIVLVVIPKQQHSQEQSYPEYAHQAVLTQIGSSDLDLTLEDLSGLSADAGVDLESNILDQDIQDLEKIL